MSPVAHTGLALLGWELAAKRKNWRTLALFILVSNLADVDFLFYLVFGPRPLFIHQHYTHNLLFAAGTAGLLALLLPEARARIGLVLTGLSHLVLDIIVIDSVRPVGIRLLFPLSDRLFNTGFFPYLQRWPAGAIFSVRNFAVLALEAAVFVVPVVWVFRRKFVGAIRGREFWSG
jgi:membrane-bound metal-dependent hydrolase YbcI (DUF457 family)